MFFKELYTRLFKSKTDSLKLLSIRSALWSIMGKGGSHVIRLAGNLILTRILFPEAFGLMATANIVLVMAELFSDTGVKTAIIQNPRGAEPAFLNTVWVINIVRGIILSSFIIAIAWPLSAFYKQPVLMNIFFIMGISHLISGFENPALPLLIKNFKVEKQVKMELVTQVVALTTTVIFAYYMQSVYALAIGYSFSVLYRLVATYFAVRYHPRFSLDKEIGKDIFNFGKYVFINTMITVTVYQLDVLLIGKVLDMTTLSYYNIGKNLGILIFTFCSQVVSQSYLPAVSSVQNDILRVQRIFKRTTTLFLTISIPVSMIMILFSHDIIRIMYDPRYELSYISLAWLAMAGIFRIIGNFSGATFFALGKPALETSSMVLGLLIVTIALFVGVHMGGLTGASCGVALAISLIPVIESIFLVRSIKFSIKTVISPYMQVFFIGGICLIIHLIIKTWFLSLFNNRIFYAVLISLFSVLLSALVFRYIEGPNPFGDRGGDKQPS
jgi:O-antigen/teichoic acid export membrane protein